jgi:hypothetical protein
MVLLIEKDLQHIVIDKTMVLGTEVTFIYNPEAKRRGHLLSRKNVDKLIL